jgi:hypothetical protein
MTKSEANLKNMIDTLAERLKKAEQQPTLRDQFAMAALNGLCGLNWSTPSKSSPNPKDHAIQAYLYADAMLAER